MSTIGLSVHKTGLEMHAAKAISYCLKQNADKPILLLVSGGSALKVLDDIDSEVLGANVTVSLVDDRFSRDPEVNNFLQLTRTEFYKRAREHGVTFISSLPLKDDSLEMISDRWERALRQWESANVSDRVILATMGIGLDGHTAGIMPYPEDPHTFSNLFESKAKWIVGYDAGSKNQYSIRLTLSILFLLTMIDHAFVYVSGENKKNVLRKIMKSDKVAEFPASIIHSMKHVELYTDVDIK